MNSPLSNHTEAAKTGGNPTAWVYLSYSLFVFSVRGGEKKKAKTRIVSVILNPRANVETHCFILHLWPSPRMYHVVKLVIVFFFTSV